jgi:hypothetical protein
LKSAARAAWAATTNLSTLRAALAFFHGRAAAQPRAGRRVSQAPACYPEKKCCQFARDSGLI